MVPGFVDGIRLFLRAFARTWFDRDLRRWYFRTLALTFLLAVSLICVLFFAGSWAFAQYFEKLWSSGLAILLWFLALLYLSGQLATLLMSALVIMVGGESALTRHYFGNLVPLAPPEARASVRTRFRDHSREIFAMIQSLVVSCVAWPLLLLPLTMPLGVLVFAWALSGDALAVSRRLCHERGYEALQDQEKLSAPALMGLALVPSSMALFPVLGWVLMPILQVAGLEMQLVRQIKRT